MVATRLQPAIVIRRAQLVPLDTTGRLLALRVMRIVILVLHHIMLLVELLLSNRDVVYVQMALIVIQMATLSLRVQIALLEPIGRQVPLLICPQIVLHVQLVVHR
jgi:hypothetical protein